MRSSERLMFVVFKIDSTASKKEESKKSKNKEVESFIKVIFLPL